MYYANTIHIYNNKINNIHLSVNGTLYNVHLPVYRNNSTRDITPTYVYCTFFLYIILIDPK